MTGPGDKARGPSGVGLLQVVWSGKLGWITFKSDILAGKGLLKLYEAGGLAG
jgi:hypothetical protein